MSRSGRDDAITTEKIRHLARLCKLTLAPQEERRVEPQLSEILDYFRLVDKANLAGAPPAFDTEMRPSAFRDDVVERCDPDPILKIVPRRKGRLVKAPRVF